MSVAKYLKTVIIIIFIFTGIFQQFIKAQTFKVPDRANRKTGIFELKHPAVIVEVGGRNYGFWIENKYGKLKEFNLIKKGRKRQYQPEPVGFIIPSGKYRIDNKGYGRVSLTLRYE